MKDRLLAIAYTMKASNPDMAQSMFSEAVEQDCGDPDCVMHGRGGVLEELGYATQSNGLASSLPVKFNA